MFHCQGIVKLPGGQLDMPTDDIFLGYLIAPDDNLSDAVLLMLINRVNDVHYSWLSSVLELSGDLGFDISDFSVDFSYFLYIAL